MKHAMKKLLLPVLLALALPTAALADPAPLPVAKNATPTLCGDANCDGQVDFSDAIAILQALANRDKYSLSATGMANADVDGNGEVTGMDALRIQMFVAGVLPDLGGQSVIGTPAANLGTVRLLYRSGNTPPKNWATAHPGDVVDVDVYVERAGMKLAGIFLRLGGELPRGVRVSVEDTYVYALDGNKEYFQVGDYFACDALKSGDPQEVDFDESIICLQLELPADLKAGEYLISPIDFCQLFQLGTSDIFDVSYSPLRLMVHDDSGIPYFDPTDAAHPAKACANYTLYNGENTLASGWWVVSGTNASTSRIAVSGDVNILLMDGAELTAAQGFHVTGTNRLTVWAQSGERTTAGKLVVSGPDDYVAGIGGDDGETGGTVTVNGGVLDITGGYRAAAIGGGRSGGGCDATIVGGTVTAVGGLYAQAIGCGSGGAGAANLVIDGMRVYPGKAATEPVAAVDRQSACHSQEARLEVCTHEYDAQGTCPFCGSDDGPVSYLDPADADSPAKVCAEYSIYTGQAALSDGWYVARGEAQAPDRIEVSGDVNLLLCDGAELAAAKGFHVTGTNRLVVWAQSNDRTVAGKLTSSEPDACLAGIGGNDFEAGGTVTVNGGVLAVAGGYKSTAIGGGRSGDGGVITVNGGFLTATGGNWGTGLGGGMTMNANHTSGNAGTITINGGEVTATGGPWSPGIGGGGGTSAGNGSSGGTVAINGGTVTATGGTYGAGIGGGRYAGCVAVAIRGGTVTAAANGGAQAIGEGAGWSGDTGTLAIDGMRVFASASATEPVASGDRLESCHGTWAKVEGCPHDDNGSGACPWCGTVAEWAQAYVDWAAGNNIAGAWNEKDADGIPNVFRYLFDQPTGAFADPPLLSLEFDADGQLLAITPPLANTNGFDLSLSAADAPEWTSPTNHPLSSTGSTPLPDEPPPASPTRFFRLQATPAD